MKIPPEHAGFSLLELLAVTALMIILITISITSQLDWGRSKALQGAVKSTKSHLGLARQMAITKHTVTFFIYGNDTSVTPWRGYHYLATNDTGSPVSSTNFLPKGMAYSNSSELALGFLADGVGSGESSTWPGGYRDVVVYEPDREAAETCLQATVRVARTTGIARIIE